MRLFVRARPPRRGRAGQVALLAAAGAVALFDVLHAGGGDEEAEWVEGGGGLDGEEAWGGGRGGVSRWMDGGGSEWVMGVGGLQVGIGWGGGMYRRRRRRR